MRILKEHTPLGSADRFREWIDVDLSNPREVFRVKREEGLGHCQYKTMDEQGNLIPFVWPE